MSEPKTHRWRNPIIFVLVITIAIACLYQFGPQMLHDYLGELVTSAWPSIREAIDMTLAIVCVVLFIFPKLIKLFVGEEKPVDGDNLSLRKVLIWKFLSDVEWRAGFLIVLFLAIQVMIVGQYQVFKANRNLAKEATKKLSVAQDQIRFNHIDGYDLEQRCAIDDVFHGSYDNAIQLFQLSFTNEVDNLNMSIDRNTPYVAYAHLMLDLNGENAGRFLHQRACQRFEDAINNWTNKMNRAITDKSPTDYFNSKNELGVMLDNLNKLEACAPDAETNFIIDTIKTVRELRTNHASRP
jgi:hypothetical protein